MSLLDFFRGKKKSADPDAEVLAQLQKAGSNLSKPHPIEFFLYLPTQSAAEEAARHVRQFGFTVEVKPAAKGNDWLCFAIKEMVPELPELQKIRRDFDDLLGASRGEYDGWGTPIVR